MMTSPQLRVAPPAPVPPIPSWIAKPAAQDAEAAVFSAGAALAYLDALLRHPDVPQALLRARLALTAARVSVRLMGRAETEGELRDAIHLLQPGDHPGPAGEVLRQWQRAVAALLATAHLADGWPQVEEVGACRDVPPHMPITAALAARADGRAAHPRHPGAALLLADATLSQVCGWTHLVPVLSLGVTAAELRKSETVQRAQALARLPRTLREIRTMAIDLAQKAARLRAVAPKLRAKAAGHCVDLLLSRDAVTPHALTHLMSDRAARRLCRRLVDLGAVRELTGRDSFRLYGL